jgi:hypothetical protein
VLAPDDRAVLREQLRPDLGAELEIAVATTFTLDLTAALVAPLAFAAHDVSRRADPVAVLEAVRGATEKIDVFCQVGHIRVPATASDLMAFLEPMVHEVDPPITGYLFHPKIWVARYRAPNGDPSFRLLCGTRNLTDDVSWDAVVRLDGRPGTRPYAVNRPLVDLVAALPSLAVRPLASERRAGIEDLAEELRRVDWEFPAGVTELGFHVLGLRRMRGEGPLAASLAGRRHLVISPFLDEVGVARATAGSTDITVVSRAEEFESLSPITLSGLECRVVSPMAGIQQPDEEDVGTPNRTSETSLLGGLHAKVYVVDAGRQARMVIGSANATSAGLDNRNVEFAVELAAGLKTLGVDQFLGEDAAFAAILEPYKATGGEPEPIEETIGRELERFLRRVAAHTLVAEVAADEGGWAEHVRGSHSIGASTGTDLRVGLLTKEGNAVVQQGDRIDARFPRLATLDVTPFVVLRASSRQDDIRVDRATVVRAELRGDPPSRLDEVIARQVDTPEKFLRFLALLLGLSGDFLVAAREGIGGGGGWLFSRINEVGVFELLVRAVAERPQAIDDLDRLVRRLQATDEGVKVLPEGFSDLWTRVRNAHERVSAVT